MKPATYIPRSVYVKIMHWINKTDLEVSGFGRCNYIKPEKGDPYFIVNDVYLLKQEVGATHTDIDPNALGRLMFETKDEPGDLNFWWHSHVNMDTTWSITDIDTIKDLGKNGYCLATVFNKKHQMRTAISFVSEAMFGDSFVYQDELPTFIYDPVSDATKEVWDKEYDDKVQSRVIQAVYPYRGNYGNYDDSGWSRNSLKAVRTAMHKWKMPVDDKTAEKIIEDMEAYSRLSTYDLHIQECAAIHGMFCYEMKEAWAQLKNREQERILNNVKEFKGYWLGGDNDEPHMDDMPIDEPQLHLLEGGHPNRMSEAEIQEMLGVEGYEKLDDYGREFQ